MKERRKERRPGQASIIGAIGLGIGAFFFSFYSAPGAGSETAVPVPQTGKSACYDCHYLDGKQFGRFTHDTRAQDLRGTGQTGSSPSIAWVANWVTNDIYAYTLSEQSGEVSLRKVLPIAESGPAIGKTTNDGRFLVIVNPPEGTVASYRVDRTGISLSPAGKAVAVGELPWALAISNDGRFVYVASWDSRTISAFRLDGSSGTLSLAGPPVEVAPGPWHMGISNDGRYLYVANQNSNRISGYRVDADTGILSAIPISVTARKWPRFIAFTRDGRYLLVANTASNDVASYAIDPVTGDLSERDVIAAGDWPWSIAVDPSADFFYVSNWNSNDIYVFGVSADGRLAVVEPKISTFGINPAGLNISKSGDILHVLNYTSDNMAAYRIDHTSGKLSFLNAIRTGAHPKWVAF